MSTDPYTPPVPITPPRQPAKVINWSQTIGNILIALVLATVGCLIVGPVLAPIIVGLAFIVVGIALLLGSVKYHD